MPTQAEIAEHLGLSQAAVSKAMMKLTLDWRTSSMDEIRLAYLNRLRAEASGHVSSSGLDLVEEKAKTERVRRELAMMELMEKQGLLVNIDDIKGDITLALLNFKNALLSRNERLKARSTPCTASILT
jgi:predicted transcriptional regulator